MSMRFRIVLSLAFAMLGVMSCLAYAGSVREQADRVRQDAIARFSEAFGGTISPDEVSSNCKIIPLSILSNVHKRNSGQNSGREKLREVP